MISVSRVAPVCGQCLHRCEEFALSVRRCSSFSEVELAHAMSCDLLHPHCDNSPCLHCYFSSQLAGLISHYLFIAIL